MARRAARALWDEEDVTVRPTRPELSLVDTPVPEPERRTVVITGQRPEPRRRAPAERVGGRPDRIAMWAFFLGLFLVFVATATADAAPL